MKTYIFLDIEDKKRIIKLAQSKQLSFSTTCGIIIRQLYVVNDWHEKERNNYIHKGENQICIKIRDMQGLTASIATNCIYQYLHEEVCKFNIKAIKRQIQSEMDKTIDHNANKNLEIRIAYRIQQRKLGKWQ